jgi:rhamnogalacturonyl hydrolase YesR
MPNNKLYRLALAFLLSAGSGLGYAGEPSAERARAIDQALDVARVQSLAMAETLQRQHSGQLPRSTGRNGALRTSSPDSWVSGFFPGVLWYLYENFDTETLETRARQFTGLLEQEKYHTGDHDVGFIVFCSFGNGYRLTGDPAYREVIRTACATLSKRFDSTIGSIRSWDFGRGRLWNYPVIIDNMMNLEMLLWGGEAFGEKRFTRIATEHAERTLRNHFREDASSYHVVSYHDDGSVELKRTWQGHRDDSSWARGQAWGLYGFVMMYRFTENPAHLEKAIRIADFIIDHPNLPEDKIPYWDFDAPGIPDALRDASAGAIICSALLELSRYVEGEKAQKFIQTAEAQIDALCSPAYLAEPGTNNHFILKHSVGHYPEGSEVDVPLIYADYYFVEALTRYKKHFLSKAKLPQTGADEDE